MNGFGIHTDVSFEAPPVVRVASGPLRQRGSGARADHLRTPAMNHRRFEGPPPSLPGQRMEAPPSLALGTTHLTHRASSPPSTPYSYSATVGNFGSACRWL